MNLCSASYVTADNVTLLAFAAERRRAAIDRYLLTAGPTAANPRVMGQTDGNMDEQTDRETDGHPTVT